MDLATIVSNVGRRTLRPDKADDIVDAVNDAIEFATLAGDFASDLVEGDEDIDSAEYTQSLVISTTFTRFRKLKYLRPSGYSTFLSWQDPSTIFDANGRECVDVWYRAGDNIVFKLSSLQSNMLYGYYQYPARLEADDDTHWMLDQMYAAIFSLACADIWESIGNDAEAARFRTRGNRLLDAHVQNHRDGVSHS